MVNFLNNFGNNKRKGRESEGGDGRCGWGGRGADLILGGGFFAKLKQPLFDGGRVEPRPHRRNGQQTRRSRWRRPFGYLQLLMCRLFLHIRRVFISTVLFILKTIVFSRNTSQKKIADAALYITSLISFSLILKILQGRGVVSEYYQLGYNRISFYEYVRVGTS